MGFGFTYLSGNEEIDAYKRRFAHLNQYIRSMPSIFPCTLAPAKHFTADKVSKGPLCKIVDDYSPTVFSRV